MTLTTVAPILTDAGVIAPTYYEVVEFLKEKYRGIYGQDAYLENDSQDGQWIGVIARAIADCGASCIDVYSTFSPKTATKEALSRNVAINGIKRATATHSIVDLVVSGIPGTTITNGHAADENGNKWMFPEVVLIPPAGSITFSAKSSEIGAVLALPDTVVKIGKPTRGWQGVTNPSGSMLGAAVEEDTKLRQRQALSVAIPSQSKTDSIKGAIFSLEGVSRCKTYENDTPKPDKLGIPPNSLCVVVSGGDATEIAQIMRAKKSMGCGYYGNTTVTVINTFSEPEQISFYRPNAVDIGLFISLVSSSEYTNEIGEDIAQSLADYVNQLDIGDRITLNKLYVPAGLFGNLDSMTYEISSIKIIANGVEVDGDLVLGFNEVVYCDSDNIDINISGGG